jgi:transposase-like protein
LTNPRQSATIRGIETPKTLQQAIQYFTDEQVCIDAVASLRWPEGPECPDCLGEHKKNPYYIRTQKRWKCRWCRRQFSVKLGTIFEDSPITLQKWLPALWMLCNDKNGISSWELHRALGVTQKTAWFMLHRLRKALTDNRGFGKVTKLGGPDSEVEVDETFVGGLTKHMHKGRLRAMQQAQRDLPRKEASYRYVNKTPVQGILDRELRQVRVKSMPDVRRDTLQSEVLKNVRYGSRIYTDDAVTYQLLNWRYIHEVVSHADEYVRGRVHTNGLENFWSLLKRTLRGTYVAVEPFHLDRYLAEQVFRLNNRATKDNPLNDSDRFVAALAQVAGKRLTYKELTGKTGDATATPATTPEPEPF